jgi:hypothetical protein
MMTIPTHKLYKSTRIKGRFALDNPDGPTLSSWHPIVLVLGPFALAGHVETDSDTSWFVVLGIGAPAFHPCNDASEMTAKGMTQNRAGEWTIDESHITHRDNWAYLKEQAV